MWIKLSKWSTWQNYVHGALEMEQFSFATPRADFPVKWAAGAFVLFADSNPSFAAFNLVEDGAQLSINSSNKPSDTSIMCSAVGNCVSKHNAVTHCAFISGTKSLFESVFPYKDSAQYPMCSVLNSFLLQLWNIKFKLKRVIPNAVADVFPSGTNCINHVPGGNSTLDSQNSWLPHIETAWLGPAELWSSPPSVTAHMLLHQPVRLTLTWQRRGRKASPLPPPESCESVSSLPRTKPALSVANKCRGRTAARPSATSHIW